MSQISSVEPSQSYEPGLPLFDLFLRVVNISSYCPGRLAAICLSLLLGGLSFILGGQYQAQKPGSKEYDGC